MLVTLCLIYAGLLYFLGLYIGFERYEKHMKEMTNLKDVNEELLDLSSKFSIDMQELRYVLTDVNRINGNIQNNLMKKLQVTEETIRNFYGEDGYKSVRNTVEELTRMV